MRTTKVYQFGLVLGLSLLGFSGTDLRGETKQLKEVSPLTLTAEMETQADGDAKTDGDAQAALPDTDPLQNNFNGLAQNDPNGNVQSYSIVTENRVGPDGKRIQKKRVWKNGVLVEDKEEAVEGDAGEDLSAEMDGERIPGTVSRSELNGNNFFMFPNVAGMDENAAEMLKQMENEFNARRAQIMNGFGNGVRGNLSSDSTENSTLFAPVKMSEYWIGASVTQVPAEVAYQLNLSEGEGIFIREIVPGSPAEKAGLAKYDVLLKFGDEAVSDISQIGEIVDQSKETPLTVEFFRKGEKKTVELTPEKRPEVNQQLAPLAVEPESSEADAPAKVMVVRPGMIVPDKKAESAEPDSESLVTAPEPEENAELQK